jgi:hypothetical protein
MATLAAAMLISTLFAPPNGPAASELESHVGLGFSESIPAHERAHLNDVFSTKLQEICDPAPCFESCGDDIPTIGLELDGVSRDYDLRWFTTTPGQGMPRRLESSCELCSLVELEDRIAEDLSRVCGELSMGQLTLSSEPSHAHVRVDGHPVGRTPWTSDLSTGPHQIELRAARHTRVTTTVTIAGGQERQLHLSLVPTFAAHGRRPKWPAWTLLGAGVVMGLAGTALIAVDGKPWTGRCSGTDVDGEGDCRFLLNTRPLGIGLAAAGVAAVSAGFGLFFWARKDPAGRAAGIQLYARF